MHPRAVSRLHADVLCREYRCISVDLPGHGSLAAVPYSLAHDGFTKVDVAALANILRRVVAETASGEKIKSALKRAEKAGKLHVATTEVFYAAESDWLQSRLDVSEA